MVNDPMAAPYNLREAAPIWMAALLASQCLTTRGGQRAVRWDFASGKALYTNSGATPEIIEPLGVYLERGQTLAISWVPGDTAYTVEVC